MSLMKRRTMTEKQKAAAKANGSRSRGPSTREGRENIRAAHLRHGLYAQTDDVVLDALGEEREEFEKMRQGLHDSWPFTQATHRALVDELAAANWRLDRIELRSLEFEAQHRSPVVLNGKTIDWIPNGDPDTRLRFMSMESGASREMFRLIDRLLEARDSERKTSLAGITRESIENKE
jgi:hypothetical protein